VGRFPRREYVTATRPYEILARGWLDPRHHDGLERGVDLTVADPRLPPAPADR
jgi:hypothetical protein